MLSLSDCKFLEALERKEKELDGVKEEMDGVKEERDGVKEELEKKKNEVDGMKEGWRIEKNKLNKQMVALKRSLDEAEKV